MNRVYKKKVYPTRESELPRIKKARMKDLRAIIGSQEPYTQTFELTMLEYVMLIIMYECSTNTLVSYVDLVVEHGAFYVIIAHILITIVLTMPLYMLLTFMGSYSKKSYLGMFACAPLFEGLGYMLGIIRIVVELYNSSLAAIALLIFFHCLVSQYKDELCQGLAKFINGTYDECLTRLPKVDYNFSCNEDGITLLTATQYYVHTKVVRIEDFNRVKIPEINYPLLTSLLVIWCLILFLAMNGIKRLKGLTINLQFVFGFFVITSILLSICYSHDVAYYGQNIFGSQERFFSFDFWSNLFMYTVGAHGFGNLIWLATIKPKSVDPKFAIILTSQIKIVIFALFACTISIICQENRVHFRIRDLSCLPVNGFDLIFCFIPDVLFRAGIRNLVIPMWYVIIFYFSFLTPLYTVIGLVDSITQRFRTLNQYKFYVCSTICAGSFLLNVILVTNIGTYVITVYKECSMPLVSAGILLLTNLALFFAYSSRSILDDYLFTYGVNPEKYWITFWKSSPIFAIFAFIFVGYNQYQMPECSKGNYVIILGYLNTFCMFFPVFLMGFIRCCTQVRSEETVELSKPDNEWGPYDPIDREIRKTYLPHREIRYRTTTLKCKHRCCCSFPLSYQKRVRIEHAKLEKLEIQFNKDVQSNSQDEEKHVTESVISSDSSIIEKTF